jgi:cytochrome oxidase Cu insertion factor (SCO1/SenC/PrrC family)
VKIRTALVQVIVIMLIAASASSSSRLNSQRNVPVAVGEVAPDFTLADQNGNKLTLSDSRGKSPVVLVFYRGYW